MSQNNVEMTDFTKKVKEELRVFNNFSAILDKADNDGYIKLILESLSEIFNNELNFAIKGNLTRAPKTQRKEENAKPQETRRNEHLYIQGEYQTDHKLLRGPNVQLPNS